MPELPEVETIKNQLQKILPFKIKKTHHSPFIESILKEKEFVPTKKTITKIKRKGKWLNFEFANSYSMISHLGMSGSWILSKEKIKEKHTHFQLEGEQYYLGYVDPRRFGKLYLVKEKRAKIIFDKLGVDVTSKEFSFQLFNEVLNKFPAKKIKVLLLEQKFFSGIGNYLASEICAHAHVLPTKDSSTLKKSKRQKLFKSISHVVNRHVKARGTTFQGAYRDTDGAKGDGSNQLTVFYQKNCLVCGSKVEKITLGGRGTYFCPECQK